MVRYPFLGFSVVLIVLFSCAKPTLFEINASYRSATTPARQYDIYTNGEYPAGADMADAYQGRIVVKTNDTRYQLIVNAEHFTPKLSQVELPADLEYSAGQTVDAVFLMKFIIAIDPTASKEQIHKEAEELFAILESAGMGPKIGLPDTKALVLISASYNYL